MRTIYKIPKNTRVRYAYNQVITDMDWYVEEKDIQWMEVFSIIYKPDATEVLFILYYEELIVDQSRFNNKNQIKELLLYKISI